MPDALPRATRIATAASFAAADRIVLDFDERFRRRKRYRSADGIDFLLDLPEAQLLRDGDGLVLEDGRVIRVCAAEEPLVEVRGATAAQLVRLAWHLGNRHLPVELQAGRILIREDHVIEQMLRGLGAELRPVRAPFNPEGGAYGEHNRSTHRHQHDH